MDYLCYKLSEMDEASVDTAVLTEAEQQLSPMRRLARALLRHEIARRTGISAAKVPFTYNEHGKPLTDGLHFNISHSADFLCMAFHHEAVGVDIQQKRRHADIGKLAPRIMCSEQLERFRERGEREEDFYTCWSIAEALVKLHGSTIWKAADYPFLLFENGAKYCNDTAITIDTFQPHPDYYGAVAYRLST